MNLLTGLVDPHTNLLPYDGTVNDLSVLIERPDTLYRQLLDLPWQADVVTLFGKTHVTQRQLVWMGEANQHYRYAGTTHVAQPWHPAVFHVKQRIEQYLNELNMPAAFNTCLLNYYPTGEQGMGYHSDDEPELGQQPVIASVSLGATRQFVFKHKVSKEKVKLALDHGQVLVMRGQTQQHWRHSITKSKRVTDARISLTFRRVCSLEK